VVDDISGSFQDKWSTRKAASSRRAAVSASTRDQNAWTSRAAAADSIPQTTRMRASGMPSRRSQATSRARSNCSGA
jgi:hypothetical protein